MEFAAAEGALFGEEVGDGAEFDGVERDLLDVPVERVLAHDDAAGHFPFFQRESAVAHEGTGPGPKRIERIHLAVLEDCARVHGDPAVVAEELQEVRDRILELDDERARVGRAEADGPEVLGLTGVEMLGAADTVQHRGVFGAEARREHPLVTEEEIGGGHRVAVRPAGIFAQAEGPGLAVFRHRPAFGDAGDGVQVLRVVIHQAFEEGGDNMALTQSGNGLRI